MRPLVASAIITLISGMAVACPAPQAASRIDIYPTARVLPANLLRMYAYFPSPMARDGILDHVTLQDAKGVPIEGVFLSNRFDLWSPDSRRLTLLLDPGRVKTGLAAHEAMGRALTEGAEYTLSIAGTALDAAGCAVGADTSYTFSAGAPDTTRPSPQTWDLTVPVSGTRQPLVVAVNGAHDHLSLAYRIRVQDGAGANVAGMVDLGPAETSWIFVPTEPWRSDTYRLAIDERLEDLAGNRPGGLFDRPVGRAEIHWPRTIDWKPK